MSKSRKRRKSFNPKFLGAVLGVLVLLLALCVLINRWKIEFVFNDDEVIAEYGENYQDEGVEAYVTGTLLKFYKKPVTFTSTNNIDTNTLGTYTINYKATDGKVTGETTRTVKVEDHQGPVITLVSSPDSYTLPGREYVEEGFSAVDAHDGDVSENVKVSQGDGIVTYEASDSFGNTTIKTRQIVYDDRQGPTFNLDGGSEILWTVDNEYVDQYTCEDDLDGPIQNVTVTGSVDYHTVGDYVLTYSATDSYGNTSEATRLVHVVNRPTNDTSNLSKIIYLTFDDGPSIHTPRLLDILDKYNVKATFFVTNFNPDYAWCIKEAYNRGHTIAVHTYTHDYAQIYASDEAFWNDFEAIENVIVEQTGSRTNLFRFPGGSSNTISANYSSGIMTRLTQQANEKGLVYFDWNISSGDAGETTDPAQVYANIVNNVVYYDYSVVLCHDIKGYTVDAMDDTILWCLNNGFTFLPLTESSYTAHHGVNN